MQLSWSILLFYETRQIVCFFVFNNYKIVGKGWVKRTFVCLNKYKWARKPYRV